MKKSLVRIISLLIALFGMCFAVRDAGALDAPHNTNDKTWSITCSLCHYNPSVTPSWASMPTATDNTFVNNLCKYCHTPSKMTGAYADAMTHSSYQTSTKYNGGNPWVFDCTACHSPHYQQQATIYSGDVLNSVVTGTITSIITSPSATFSSITDSKASFSDYSGYLLIPNIAHPNRIFRIYSNTSTQLTVDGAINLNYTGVGATYAIRFSKMIKDQIQTPNSGQKPVKVFKESGPMSFGTGTSSSVCQVCHTETHSYRNDGFTTDPVKHVGDDDMLPQGLCKKCHQHLDGFNPPTQGCNDCHGNPPQQAVEGPYGLIGYSALTNTVYLRTGATLTNPGAHLRHGSTLQMSCEVCHKGSKVVMPKLIDKKIRMGFEVNSGNWTQWAGPMVSSGTITSLHTLINGYSWTATTANTLLYTGSSYTPVCSAVYCHGGGTVGLVSLAGGSNRTPSWMGGPSQAVCGTCHGYTAATYTSPGNHNRHVAAGTEQMNMPCSDCHGSVTNYSHINGSAGWDLNLSNAKMGSGATYRGAATGNSTGMLAPSTTYGQCANMYCHSSVQANGGVNPPSSYATPTWGDATVNCDTCHGQALKGTGEPATGTHSTHMTGYTQIACPTCHTNGGDNTSQHADRLIQTGINTTWGASATYSKGTHTPQTGYGSCSAVYCHSQGTSTTSLVAPNVTPNWGNVLDCTGCHSYNANEITYQMSTKAHNQHIKDNLIGAVGRNITCAECHNSTVSSGDSPVTTYPNHVNKLANIKFDNVLNKNSENPLYNGLTTTLATGATKTVGLTGYNCSNLYCHSIGNLSGTNPNTNTVVTAGGASFRTIAWDSAVNMGCDGCHGTAGRSHPSYGPGSAGTITANSHVKHVESYNYGCDLCHVSTTTDPKAWPLLPTYVNTGGDHLNRVEDVSFKVYNGFTGTYSGTTKVCMTTYCHGTGQPVWGGSAMACGSCHGNPPATGAHLLHVSAGVSTLYGSSQNLSTTNEYRFDCGNCHPGSSTSHYNGSVDIMMQSNDANASGLKLMNSTTASKSGSGLNMVCLNIYCHSNGLQIGVPNSNVLTTAASPSWGVTPTGNKCANCHGNPPTYASAGAGVAGANSHYNATGFMGQEGGHLVGQHFDNIFSGTTGTLSAGTSGNSSHGNSTTATSISCLTCHNSVVSSTTIDTYAMYGTVSAMNCSTTNCHSGSSTTKLQAGMIANKGLHVNGAANVAFITPMRSKAQLVNVPTPTWTRIVGYKVSGGYDTASLNDSDWNSGTKTCTTACHNSEPVTWGDPNVTCYSCHKGL